MACPHHPWTGLPWPVSLVCEAQADCSHAGLCQAGLVLRSRIDPRPFVSQAAAGSGHVAPARALPLARASPPSTPGAGLAGGLGTAGLGAGSCTALASSAAARERGRGARGPASSSGFLVRFGRSPLKPAVPERRLRSGEGIFLSSQGKCSGASCELLVPPGPASPQPPGSGKVHRDLLSRACQTHPRGCRRRCQPSSRGAQPPERRAASLPPHAATGAYKGSLVPAQPQLATASLAGARPGTGALVLFMPLPWPPGGGSPGIRAKRGWWWVRQGCS